MRERIKEGGWWLRDVSQEVHCLPLSFSTWRALPLQLTSSNRPVSFPLQPAPSLSSGPSHGLQLWEESENVFGFGVNGWNKVCSLLPGLMWGLEKRLDTITDTSPSFAVSVFLPVFERRRKQRKEKITWDEGAWGIQERKGLAVKEENRRKQQHQEIIQ